MTPWWWAADSEGLALAALLLAQRLELTGMVVPGTLDGSPHFWNVVRTESGYRHLDLTRGADSRGQYPLLSDREMAALGYQWDTQAVPPAGSRRTARRGRRRFPAPPPPPPTGRNEIILNFFILCLTATNFLL